MTTRVGAKGQVFIPKHLREQLNLHPGDSVEVALEDGQLVVRGVNPPAALGGRFRGSGMAARLLDERHPRL